ncbi:MAG: WD40 repeat domain-containing protein [Candidatus Hodarchaeales archaeon]
MLSNLVPRTTVIKSGLVGHRFSVMRFSSFHHSNRFASSSFDGTVRIWNGKTQEKVLFHFSEAIEGLEVARDDNKIIVILSDSSQAYVYDLTTEELTFMSNDLVIRNLFATNPSSTVTAITSFDDEIYFYDHKRKILSNTNVFVENLSGDSLVWLDDKIIAVPKRNGHLAVVDSEEKTVINEVQIHDGLITSICRDGDKIVTVSEDGTGKVMNLEFQPLFGFKIDFTPLSVAYRDELGLIAVTGDRDLLIVNSNTKEVVYTKQDLSGSNVIILSSGELVKGSGEHDISLYNEKGEVIYKIKGRSNSVESAFFLGESQLVFGSGDKNVHLYNFIDGEERILARHNETVSAVISVDGVIIAGSFDDSISIWGLSEDKEIKRISGVPLVTAIASSPSRDIFAAGCSGDNSIRIFSSKGEELTDWIAHEDYINTVLFLNDDIVISGSDDNTLKFWKKDGKLISSLSTDSPVKAIDTTPELDFYVVGHLKGELDIFEKISNRRLARYNVSKPIQKIKILDASTILFGAQNILYLLTFDGTSIEDVQEVCRHTEPVKAISWVKKRKEVLSVDSSLEIIDTVFLKSDLNTSTEIESESESDTTVMFAPGVGDEEPEMIESQVQPEAETIVDEHKAIENLEKISEYFNTVLKQIDEMIAPELESFGIDTYQVATSMKNILESINTKLEGFKAGDLDIRQENEGNEEKPDWTGIDWGKKRPK